MGTEHVFVAGDLGCGTGLPREFLRRVRAIPVGDSLRTIVSDAASVKGHLVLPIGGQRNCPVVAIRTAQRRP